MLEEAEPVLLTVPAAMSDGVTVNSKLMRRWNRFADGEDQRVDRVFLVGNPALTDIGDAIDGIPL